MPLPKSICSIKPPDRNWISRVKVELRNLRKYAGNLKSSWFVLQPDKSLNYQKWDGYLVKKNQLNSPRTIHILLSSHYPLAAPQCFIEKDFSGMGVLDNNLWIEEEREFLRVDLFGYIKSLEWDPSSMGLYDFLSKWVIP